MPTLNKNQMILWGVLVLVVAVALWIFAKKGGAIGYSLGKGAAETVTGAATGVVVGASEIVGIPPTDTEKCAACKKAKDWFKVSVYCPASDFLSYMFASKK